MRIARRLIVHGKVQGVFYRDWTVRTARSLDLRGWVRNEADGTVAAHLEGEDAAVRQMIDSMRRGPPAARVLRVEEADAAPSGSAGFERR
jgi:acylphosphatase